MASRVWLVIAALSVLGQLRAQSDWSAVAQRAKNSVVKITARTKDGEATGTGFVVSADGKIATNYHVIEGASKIFVNLPNGKTVGIQRVVASDKRVDLAILQVRGVSLPPLSLGDSNAVKIGQEICVMGSPLGLEQSFSTGVVSAKRVIKGFEWIQITAPISPGSSGSPVMTRGGLVIGVATFNIRDGQNLNFASPVKYLRMLLNKQSIRPEQKPQPEIKPNLPSPEVPPAPQESPSSLLVTNAEELVSAISEIRNGGEITLQPGEYRLREPLLVRKSITITGAGYEESMLIFEGMCIYDGGGGKCGGIKFFGDGILSIRDVSLRYAGADSGCSVIEVAKGDLRLTRCFISGGVGNDKNMNAVGSGVLIHGTSQVVVSDCIVADNEVGIRVVQAAKARIELSKIFMNDLFGVEIAERASSELRHCEILDNGIGIFASGESRIVVRNNDCNGNRRAGIVVEGGVQGEFEGNTCVPESTIVGAYTLKLNVKEGDTFKYRMSMEIDFGGQNLLATTTITNKVLKVEENGNIQMESASGEMVIKFGDQEMPQPAPPATKMTFKPNGSLVKADGGNGVMQQMTFPEKPVKVGDKWSETVKNPNGELAIDYELVGVEKVGDTEAVKIKVTARAVNAKEGEGYSADGFTWVDPKTGMTVKMETRIKGMQVEGAPMPIDGTLKMELVK